MLVKNKPITIYHHSVQKLALEIFKIIEITREAIKIFWKWFIIRIHSERD